MDCRGLRIAAAGVAAARPALEAGVAKGVCLVESVAGRLGVGCSKGLQSEYVCSNTCD